MAFGEIKPWIDGYDLKWKRQTSGLAAKGTDSSYWTKELGIISLKVYRVDRGLFKYMIIGRGELRSTYSYQTAEEAQKAADFRAELFLQTSLDTLKNKKEGQDE